jgi:flagellar hook protein FlgE
MVMSLPAISLSGMKAAQTSLGAYAHNLANLSTPGFHRDQAMQVSVPSGGVTTSLSLASHAGHAMESDIVGQLEAKNLFLANLAMFKTSDQVLGSLLDITS